MVYHKRRLKEVIANVNNRLEATYKTSDLRAMYQLTKHDQMRWAAAMGKFVKDLRVVEKVNNVSLVRCIY